MRLYLSSFRLGERPERLLALLRRPGPALVVANACDDATPQERAGAVALERDALAGLGLTDVSELDLRESFGSPERLTARLAGAELLWVRGGNVFVLRHALAASGADEIIADLLRRDALVYAGYSAGPCVLAPSLQGLEHCDDPRAVRRAYGAEARYDGLGLLDEALVPHVDSPGHPESALLGEVAARYRAAGVPHRTLRDGQALVVHGDLVELV